ncbi:MAG: glycoside hydrolase family 31 protein [Clostridium sp.]|jgi:alpha-D-xyloside xylohydrolase|nr:glycoside hydrolase family 31 protein [Clostridium sp.]
MFKFLGSNASDGLSYIFEDKNTARQLHISVITDKIIRFTYTDSHDEWTHAGSRRPSSDIFVNRDHFCTTTSISQVDSIVTIRTSSLRISIHLDNESLEIFDIDSKQVFRQPPFAHSLQATDLYHYVYDQEDAKLSTNMTADGLRANAEDGRLELDRKGYTATLRFDWQEEALFGLGSFEGGRLNLRSGTTHLFQQNMDISVPVLVSSRGYGLLFDCMSYMRFEDDETQSSMYMDAVERLDYYFMFGPSMDGVVAQYRDLTGDVPLLPKWAFGYWQSKERYETANELLEIAQRFRKEGLPIDAIVQDWKTWEGDNWGEKIFDASRFPNPCELTDKLHDMNLHLVLSIWPNTMPGGINNTEFLQNGSLLGNRSTYNAFDKDARALYWKQTNDGLFSKGVDAWWCDCTEPFECEWKGATRNNPEDTAMNTVAGFKKYIDADKINGYSFYHSMGIYEGQRGVTDRKRVLNLTRSAFTGQQRFATVAWSGDISATWQVFREQLAAGLNFCATGNPYWTFDIGGFFVKSLPGLWFWKGDYPDGCKDPAYRELYVRWLQMGTFMPIMRSHGTDTPREPWQFGQKGDIFYDTIVRYLKLRYQLLPYLYSLAADVSFRSGTMLRMLAFDFDDSKTWAVADQFMLGRALMVCPVSEPMYYRKEATRDVYLPLGKGWYDFYTHAYYEGGQTIHAAAPLNIIPVFVPCGSILPMCEASVSTADADFSYIHLFIYEGSDASFVFYDDAGDSYDYEQGVCMTIPIDWDDTGKVLRFGTRNGKFEEMHEQMTFSCTFINKYGKRQSFDVSYHGSPLELRLEATDHP